MAQKIRNGALILLAAVVLAFAAWMLWPRSIGDAVDLGGREIDASIITSGVRDGEPYQEMEQYTLSTGSNQAEAILELLGENDYHLCWDTLTGETSISGIGDLNVTLYAVQDDALLEFSVYNGTGKARLNDRVVRIGYLAQGKAATLCEQLSAILRSESGVAN